MPTKIEWTNGGDTWNPIIAINRETGKRGWFCVHADDSCIFCYSARQNMTAHWLGNGLDYVAPNLKKVRIEIEPKVLDKIILWSKPRNVFVCSMTDLFGDWVTDDMLSTVWRACQTARQHQKQILTKRVDRMTEFLLSSLPRPDFWIGFSAGRQKTFDERWAQIKPLAEAGWTTWVSLEPLLEKVVLPHDFLKLSRWTVSGGESGPKARPSHPDWFRSLRDQCDGLVPYFFKQWGEWVSVSEVSGDGIHHHFDDGATVRRVGKHIAGRLLDGREWSEYPK